MPLTLLQSAATSRDMRRKGVIMTLSERSPVLQYLPIKDIAGNSYTYSQESVLPQVGFRGVGDTYTRSTGVINNLSEKLTILGGEVFIDNFEIATQSNLVDLKAQQWAMVARSAGIVFSEVFFEGDTLTAPKQFDGMRYRLTGNQAISAGTNGAALTLAMLDQLNDTVRGDDDKHFFLNITLRRRITSLARDISSGYTLLETGRNELGKQVTTYAGHPLHIVERDDNMATFLDFDETQGASNVTASIYCLRFGDEDICGIGSKGQGLNTYDLGEDQTAPGIIGRLEFYIGIAVHNPRAGARLKGIL